MNGPQHYAEAERLLELAATAPERVAREKPQTSAEYVVRATEGLIAEAQVHATLAAAAATVDVAGATSNGIVSPGWGKVLGATRDVKIGRE